MVKKLSALSGLSVFLLLSTAAPAQHGRKPEPERHNPVDQSGGPMLGTIEGLIHFCDKADSGSAHTYRQIDALLTSGQSAAIIDRVRDSDAYEDAFRAAIQQLEALPGKDASTVCSTH